MGGIIAYFTVAISSIGFLVAGSEQEGLQILFMKVGDFPWRTSIADPTQMFVLLTIFLLCLVQSVKEFADKPGVPSEADESAAKSGCQVSIYTTSEESQDTPPSRKADPDNPTWDEETLGTYTESVLGGEQVYLRPNVVHSIPPRAEIDSIRESHGRIVADSQGSTVEDLSIGLV